jgi:hypothetical protein
MIRAQNLKVENPEPCLPPCLMRPRLRRWEATEYLDLRL